MKKKSKFFIRGQKKIKSLLQELTMRDMQSTELKINQLINKQRSNLTVLRSLKTPQYQHCSVRRQKDLHQSYQSIRTLTGRNKQNCKYSQSSNNHKISLLAHESRNKIATVEKKKCLKSDRSSQKQQKIKDHFIGLPDISSLKNSKRNSIQNSVQMDNTQRYTTSNQTTQLAIIEQVQEPAKQVKVLNLLRRQKLQKQRSLAAIKC